MILRRTSTPVTPIQKRIILRMRKCVSVSINKPSVQGSRFSVQGSGFTVQGSGFTVQGSGFSVQGSGFKVQGSGFFSFEEIDKFGVYRPLRVCFQPVGLPARRAYSSERE
jgi:hypothetical protein